MTNTKNAAASAKKTVEIDAKSIAESYELTPFIEIDWKQWYDVEEAEAAMPTEWWYILRYFGSFGKHETWYSDREDSDRRVLDEDAIVAIEFLRHPEYFALLFKRALDNGFPCGSRLLGALTSVTEILQHCHEYFEGYFGPESELAVHCDD